MEMRRLGRGPHVSAAGLGCMGMSGVYGPVDRNDAICTIHEALDAGITLRNTGNFYGMGHNEMLIAEAVKGRPRDLNPDATSDIGAIISPDKIHGEPYAPAQMAHLDSERN